MTDVPAEDRIEPILSRKPLPASEQVEKGLDDLFGPAVDMAPITRRIEPVLGDLPEGYEPPAEPQLIVTRRPQADRDPVEEGLDEIFGPATAGHPAVRDFFSQPLSAWHMSAHDEPALRNPWLKRLRTASWLVGAGVAVTFSGFTPVGLAAAAGAYALGSVIGPVSVLRVVKKIGPNTFTDGEKAGLTVLTGGANIAAMLLNPAGWAAGNASNFLADRLARAAGRSRFIHRPESDQVPPDLIYNRDDLPPPPYRRGPVDLIPLVANQQVDRRGLSRVSFENGRMTYVLDGETYDIDGLSADAGEQALDRLDAMPGMVRLGNMIVPAEAIHNAKLEHGQLFLNIANERLTVRMAPEAAESVLNALTAMPEYVRIGNHVFDLDDMNTLKPGGLYPTIYEMWDGRRGLLSEPDPSDMSERLRNHPGMLEVTPGSYVNTRFATRLALEDDALVVEGVGGRSVIKLTESNRGALLAKFDSMPGFTRIASDVLVNPTMIEAVRPTGKGLEFLSQGRSFIVGLSPRQSGIARGRLAQDSRFTQLGDTLINTSRPHRIAIDEKGVTLDTGGIRLSIGADAEDPVKEIASQLVKRSDVEQHPDGRLEILPPSVIGADAPRDALLVGGVRINPSAVTGVGYYGGELVVDLGQTRVTLEAPQAAYAELIAAVKTPVATPTPAAAPVVAAPKPAA